MAHLTHLTGFADFFHEAFHLIFDYELRQQISVPLERYFDSLRPPETRGRRRGAYNSLGLAELQNVSHIVWRAAHSPDPLSLGQLIMQLHSEVFVHLLMMMFIHDGDPVLALRNHAMGSSTNPRSVADTRDDARDTFIVQFAPVLIAALAVKTAHKHAPQPGQTHWWRAELNERHWPALGEARTLLASLITDFQPWLADAGWLLETGDAARHRKLLDHVIEKILVSYLDVHQHLTRLWEEAQKVYCCFVKYVVQEYEGNKGPDPVDKDDPFPTRVETETFNQMTIALDRQICTTLGNLPQPRFEPVEGAAAITKMFEDGRSVDAALLAARCLHAHIEGSVGDTGADLSRALRRSLSLKGGIDWKGLEKPPAVLLMDRTATALFCCVPGERRRRTGWRIALFKTFWDIASRNRARRLRALFNQAAEASASRRGKRRVAARKK